MSSSIAVGRLQEERKNWRKDHPEGFYTKLAKKGDDSTDIMTWECGIPGKEGTPWEGGVYTVILKFSNDYPSKPPSAMFKPVIFHPNVFSSGHICLSILKEEDGWRSAITIKQLLLGIQDLLDNPNPNSPAQGEASELFRRNKAEYHRRIQKEVLKNPPKA